MQPTLERLLELSREGRHAASDYLETAALAGVVTIGCRRCGGGLAGAPGDVERARGRRARRGARARPRDLRRQRRCDPAGGDRRARPGHRAPLSPRDRGRLPERLPHPRLRPRRPHRRARRRARAGDPRRQGAAGDPGRAPAAARDARRWASASPSSRPRLQTLTKRSSAPARGARSGRRAGLGQPRPPGRAARRTWQGGRCRASTWSRSRRPRSTSSPRRRSSAASRWSSPTTRSCRAGVHDLDAELDPACRRGSRSRDGRPMTEPPSPPAAAARRRGRAALLEGPDGARADRGRALGRCAPTSSRGGRGRHRGAAAGSRSRSSVSRSSPSRSSAGGGRDARCGACGATSDLHELDLPIILLVGGATGTGKSTVATEVAYRLGITRVTSTDFVRQTMRAFFSREFMPVDPLLELRGRPRDRGRGRRGQRGGAGRLPRADA